MEFGGLETINISNVISENVAFFVLPILRSTVWSRWFEIVVQWQDAPIVSSPYHVPTKKSLLKGGINSSILFI